MNLSYTATLISKEGYLIDLKRVTKTYHLGGETIYGLHEVNLSINKGDCIAIMGPSGSGKSTLANVIGGLDKPDSGNVLVDGVDITQADDRYLSTYRNKKIGYIFQSFNLQPVYTALENVTIPLIFAGMSASARQERALKCLDWVGLADRVNHKPSELSGGQRQRVCIARALANNPEIIIADEPTGNLDSKKGLEIMALLQSLNQDGGITLFIITHDPQIAAFAKRVLYMQDGQIVKEKK